MTADGELLRRFVTGDDAAFTALARRHANFVYRTAIRRVGENAHAADEVTQSVFTTLAAKARQLQQHPSLVGWLHTSTRFAAAAYVRAERRRRFHEQEAHVFDQFNSPDPVRAETLDPVLDEVLDALAERDREAVILHFFEGCTFAEVAAVTRATADGTRMRVNRALDRLKSELQKRGIASTGAALATVLSTQSARMAIMPDPAKFAHVALLHAGVSHGTVATITARLLRLAQTSGAKVAAVFLFGFGCFVALTARHQRTPVVELPPAVAPAALAQPQLDADGALPASSPSPAAQSDGAVEKAAAPSVAREALSPGEFNLMATLWHLQRGISNRRIILMIGAGAPNHPAIDPLVGRHFIADTAETPRFDRISLTSSGIQFCKANATSLEAYTPIANLREAFSGVRTPRQ